MSNHFADTHAISAKAVRDIWNMRTWKRCQRTHAVCVCVYLSLFYEFDLLYPASSVCLAVSPVYKSQNFLNNALKYNMFDLHNLIHLLSYNLTTPLLVSTLAFSRPSTASLAPMHVCVRSGGRGGERGGHRNWRQIYS